MQQHVNEAIKPFQSMGMIGERDIHKKVLDLPIPLYQADDPLHEDIARLGSDAGKLVKTFIANSELPSTLARQRIGVREHIAPTLERIDEMVEELL